MTRDSEASGDTQKIILIIGVVAVVLAVLLLVAFLPKEPEIDPHVVELEQQVSGYTAQIDSLNAVVDGLNGRLDGIRSQMDSVRASNRTFLASLHRVTNEMKEYRRLYREQQTLNRKLAQELRQVRVEKKRAITEAEGLKSEVDSLNNALYEKTVRLVRLEASLEQAVKQTESLEAAVRAVLVYSGTEDELKQAGYLKTGRSVIFRKSYRAIGFPDVVNGETGGAVFRASLGDPLVLQGTLSALADRHGKLGKGKEYRLQKGPPGQTVVTFIDSTLQGQRILAILKKSK